MATRATWTVIFQDKIIMKSTGIEAGTMYEINDDVFWSQSKFSNIWAIQYGTSPTSDEVEHRDSTPHCSFADANIGNFQDFIDKWDAAHLNKMQSDWDNDNITVPTGEVDDQGYDIYRPETEAEKIARIGQTRPTSYSS